MMLMITGYYLKRVNIFLINKTNKRMKKTLLLFALCLSTGMQSVMAQTRTVKGTVLDESGQPLPGASVKVTGTSTGAVTSFDGTFEVTVPDGASGNLEISALGYSKKTIAATDGVMAVNLDVSTSTMGEVMIVGYQATTKEKYVGSADKIDAKRLEKFPVTDITKAIEGAAPGIQVTNGGGQPGGGAAIRVRGVGSVSADASPLYVVDGTPYVGDVTSINPLDIASITVLKDATATSLYGSRGANGVIVITTKTGKRGSKASIRVDAKVGIINRAVQNYKVIKDEKAYYEFVWDAYRNQLITAGYSVAEAGEIAAGLKPAEEPGVVDRLGYNSYNVPNNQLLDANGKLNPNATLRYHDDWDKEMQRNGFRQDYSLAASGGSEKSDYYISLGYLKENGFMKYSDYDRFSSRINVNTQASTWLRAGLNLSASLSTQNYLGGAGTTAAGANPFFASRSIAPIFPVYYRDSSNNTVIDPLTGEKKYDWGSTALDPTSSMGQRIYFPSSNVLGQTAFDQNRTKIINIIAAPYLEATFLKDFTFRTQLNANYYGTYETNYQNPIHGSALAVGGRTAKSNFNSLTYTWNQMLRWSHDFNLHHLDVSALHETYYMNAYQLFAQRTGLPAPGITDLSGAAVASQSASQTDNERMESYLAFANYDYSSKYFLTASIRRDGSSRFHPDVRWGNFWAVGGGWMISGENFMKDASWIDMLKIKLSYGTQGNQGILNTSGTQNYYPYQSLYDLDFANGQYAGAIVSTLANPTLTWEKSRQANAGLEFGIFKNRVSGEINVFEKTNADLLFNRPFAVSTGIATRAENTLTMKNRGIELTINADIVKTRNFTWNISTNLTHYNNKITKMADGIDSLIVNNFYMRKAGHSIYEFYLVESAGLNDKGNEEYYYYNSEGQRADTTDYTYALSNGGRDFRGSSLPKLMGALTNNFSYKGFDLTFMVTFGVGGKYLDQIYQGMMETGLTGLGSNWHEDMLTNRWTEDNKTGTLPKAEFNNLTNSQMSTRFLTSGDYLSIRNINIGYTFPTTLFKGSGIESLRVFASADNVWLFSKRQGMDPQATFTGNPGYNYSAARTIMFGVTLGL